MTDDQPTSPDDEAPDAPLATMLAHQALHLVDEVNTIAVYLLEEGDGISPEDATDIVAEFSSIIDSMTGALLNLSAALVRASATHKVSMSTATIAVVEEYRARSIADGTLPEGAEDIPPMGPHTVARRLAAAIGDLSGLANEGGVMEQAQMRLNDAHSALRQLTSDPRDTEDGPR